MRFLNVGLVLSCLIACKSLPATQGASSLRADSDGSTAPRQPDVTPIGSRPLIIVAGWGGQAVNFDPFLQFMVDAGFPRDRIEVVYYPFMGRFEDSAASVQGQLRTLMTIKYAGTSKFDVIGVSTGHFVGLYALMAAGLDGRIGKYIGLVGVGHGITAAVMSLPVGTARCPGFLCGGTLGRLVPFGAANGFISTFYRTYHDRIDQLDKCSVYAATEDPASASDGVITPPDSGRFDGVYDGPGLGGPFAPERVRVVPIPGMGHLTSITDRRYFVDLVKGCYGQGWPLPPDWQGALPAADPAPPPANSDGPSNAADVP